MKWLAGIAALLVAIWVALRIFAPPLADHATLGPTPYSTEAFEQWQASDADSSHAFAEFESFLADRGVAGVVPAWQLTRTDSNPMRTCQRAQFLVPPREDWPNIVPVLELVRDHIIPELGQVEVASAYRTQDFNECMGGASKSRHLGFAAVDLVPSKPIASRELFERLCAIQKRLGPASRFGLGAYFDPSLPGRSTGRFHVDVSGYRSWGYSQHADSSGCRAFQ